jgi:hypothetical protein
MDFPLMLLVGSAIRVASVFLWLNARSHLGGRLSA